MKQVSEDIEYRISYVYPDSIIKRLSNLIGCACSSNSFDKIGEINGIYVHIDLINTISNAANLIELRKYEFRG